MIQEDEDLVVGAELPGAKPEDVDITVHNGVLTISGKLEEEREEERSGYLVRERRSGSFRRSLQLPQDVDEDQIKANFENGVLEVKIPGAAAIQEPKRIQIGGGNSSDGGSPRQLADDFEDGKRRGSFCPVYFPDRRSLFPLPKEAPIREDVAISLFGHGQNLAARRVDLEEANGNENVRRLRHQAGSRHSEAGCSRRRSEGRAPLRDPRCGGGGRAFVLWGQIPAGRRKPIRRLLRQVLRRRAQRVLRGMASPRQAEQVDITQFFSDSTTNLLQQAAQQALEWGSLDLTSEHLLYAALEDRVVRRVLEEVGADPQAIRAQLEEEAQKGGRTDVSPSLAPDAKRALLAAYEESRDLGSSYIGPEHVLLALAADDESDGGRLLSRFGLSHTKLRGAVVRGVDTGGEAREPASATPTLDEYSRDLTQMAREGKLDPVIGRAEEVESTIEILSRHQEQPCPDRGPRCGQDRHRRGHSSEGSQRRGAETLSGKRVVQLDLSGIVAGTQYRGQFEERLKKVIDEVRENSDDLILLIDELHTVVGAGAAEGAMDASNMLKPALARGELHVVGATTIDEYRKNIEKDAALERRFQPVLVKEPSVDDTIDILRGLKDRYEAHQGQDYG